MDQLGLASGLTDVSGLVAGLVSGLVWTDGDVSGENGATDVPLMTDRIRVDITCARQAFVTSSPLPMTPEARAETDHRGDAA